MAFVAAGGRLEAYRSRLRPAANRIAAGAAPSELFAGDWSVLVGVLGTAVRSGDPQVRIAAARWRGGRFGRFARVPSTGGGFQAYARVFRNTRFRASAGGRRSRTFTAYAYPDIRLGRAHQSGGRVRQPATVRSPHTNLARRTLVLYLGHGRSASRIGAARLHGRKGFASTVVSFPPLRHVSSRDRVYLCVRGALRIGLGRPDDLSRRCGAAWVRLRG
jgi:hypothetical protein